MIYCRNCGKQLSDDNGGRPNFCTVCGAPVNPLPVPAPARSDSDLGLISMILSIVSFFVPLVGIPLAVAALILAVKDKSKNFGKFTKYGKAGLICSLVSLGLQGIQIAFNVGRMLLTFLLLLGAASM
ncbi:MAG: zinc ribbon domain-containing protein [Clostridia bacterium]|nr:zinc ribbon domain-containing protein [Clostridia bacterium]